MTHAHIHTEHAAPQNGEKSNQTYCLLTFAQYIEFIQQIYKLSDEKLQKHIDVKVSLAVQNGIISYAISPALLQPHEYKFPTPFSNKGHTQFSHFPKNKNAKENKKLHVYMRTMYT